MAVVDEGGEGQEAELMEFRTSGFARAAKSRLVRQAGLTVHLWGA